MANSFANQKNSTFNPKNNLILLEGKILLKEALNTESVKIQRIFYSNEKIIEDVNLKKSTFICHKITPELMQSISDVKTNQGIMAFGTFYPIKIPIKKSFSVILDKINDPGNMGTIIRTAACIGCKKVLVTKESVNPWSPKVLRSAMGGHFHVNIKQNLDLNEIKSEINKETKLIIADSKSFDDSIDYANICSNLNNHDKLYLVIGNEVNGVRDYYFDLKNEGFNVIRVKIPIQMDSLNCSIAFAVLAFELNKIFSKK